MLWQAAITYTNGVVHEHEFATEDEDDEAMPTLYDLMEGPSAPNYYYIERVVITPLWDFETAAELSAGSDAPEPQAT
jgi:hypothetical protein